MDNKLIISEQDQLFKINDTVYLTSSWIKDSPIELYFDSYFKGEYELLTTSYFKQGKPNEKIYSAQVILTPKEVKTGLNYFKLTLTNVKLPGTYEGFLLLKNKESNENDSIKTFILLYEIPIVEVINNELSLQKNYAKHKKISWLSQILSTPELNSHNFFVQLYNKGYNTAKVEAISFEMVADKTGINVNESFIDSDINSYSEILRGDTTLNFTVDISKLPPDHYEGVMRFYFKNGSTPLDVFVDFNIKESPILPLIVLIIGIIFGRLVRIVQSPETKAQLEYNMQYRSIKKDTIDLIDPNDVNYFQQVLSEIKYEIDHLPVSNNQEWIKKNIELTRYKLFYVKKINRINLDTNEKTQLKKEIYSSNDIDTIRSIFITAIAAIGVTSTADDVESQIAVNNNTNEPIDFGGKLMNVFNFIIRRENLKIETLSGLVYPIVYFVLLASFAIYTLYNSYIEDPTFGDDGIYDYYVFFALGLFSDIISRTVSSFTIGKMAGT